MKMQIKGVSAHDILVAAELYMPGDHFEFGLNGKALEVTWLDFNQTCTVDVPLATMMKIKAGKMTAVDTKALQKAILEQMMADFGTPAVEQIGLHAGEGKGFESAASPSGKLKATGPNPQSLKKPYHMGVDFAAAEQDLIQPGKPIAASPVGPASVTFSGPGEWGVFPVDQMQTAERVRLVEAKQMYQPVVGTSPGSRYFVVALSETVKVAARWNGESLSIRAEAADFLKIKDKLHAAGLTTVNIDKKYASLHLGTPTPQMAQRALGAVLMALDLPIDTPLPNLSVLGSVKL